MEGTNGIQDARQRRKHVPAFGVLLLVAQIACAVHVVRTGRSYIWIYIVVFVPIVGMAAYFFAEVVPGLLGSRAARHAATGVVSALDPGRNLREALRRVEITPTVQNKAALAEAYVAARRIDDAIALYREVL